SEPGADDPPAGTAEAAGIDPEGVAVRGVEPDAASADEGIEDREGLLLADAGAEVHRPEDDAGSSGVEVHALHPWIWSALQIKSVIESVREIERGTGGHRLSRPTRSSRPSRPPSAPPGCGCGGARSEEHTSELQSRENLVCRLLLEKKKKRQ